MNLAQTYYPIDNTGQRINEILKKDADGEFNVAQADIAILKTHIPTAIILPFQIVSEFASGCFLLNTLNIRIFYKVLFTSFLLSYGGLCVHLQILSLSSKRFEYKKFIQYRIAQICIVIFLTFLFI